MPIVLGITGHRNIRDEDRTALENLLRKIVQEIQVTCDPRPLILLSPLAEGADRLAARVALKAGARLIVPLPMPRELYEQDFHTEASRAEFADLMRQATLSLELPLARDPKRSADALRKLQYPLVGVYVARHCQILIALWDGMKTDKMGSTGQIVEFKRTGRVPYREDIQAVLQQVPAPFGLPGGPLDDVETGPVYHVVTPRLTNPRPEKGLTVDVLLPHEEDTPERRGPYLDRLGEIHHQVAAFNRDALRLAPVLGKRVGRSTAWLFPDQDARELPAEMRALRDFYGVADALALFFQRRTLWVMRGLFVMLFFATLAFILYSHLVAFPTRNSVLLQVYLALMGLAVLWYLWARWGDYQDRYQDYRALAEGLRVQFFWRLGGLEHSVSDYYLRTQKSELDWIRHAIQACALQVRPVQPALFDQVRTRWVKDQHGYFRRAAGADQNRLLLLQEAGNGFLVFGLALAVSSVLHRAPTIAAWSMTAVLVSVCLPLLLDLARQARHRSWPVVRRRVGSLAFGVLGGLLLTLLLWAAPAVVPPHIWTDVLGFKERIHAAEKQAPAVRADTYELMMVAMALTAVVAALLHGYVQTRALSEEAKQYQRMGLLYAQADRRLGELLDGGQEAAARQLIEELGKEALAENGHWLLLHRERPMEVPRPY